MHIALYKMQFASRTASVTCTYLPPRFTSQGYYTTESAFVYGISRLKKKLKIPVQLSVPCFFILYFTRGYPLQYMVSPCDLVEESVEVFLPCPTAFPKKRQDEKFCCRFLRLSYFFRQT